MFSSLSFDAARDPDFFWVFVGRTLYYLSMSCLSFIFYYVRDVGGIENEAQRKYSVALVVILAQVGNTSSLILDVGTRYKLKKRVSRVVHKQSKVMLA